jgi:6-phosphofructokinase 1
MKIGILTSGGDAPVSMPLFVVLGKQPSIIIYMEVIGILNGFTGLLEKDFVSLSDKSLSGILNLGGTILGTTREKTFRKLVSSPDEKDRQQIKNAYHELGLDCLVCIGGNGTQRTSWMLSEIGLNVIGVPKPSIMMCMEQMLRLVSIRR